MRKDDQSLHIAALWAATQLSTAFVHRFGLSALRESSLLVSYRPLARVGGLGKKYSSHAGRILRRRP